MTFTPPAERPVQARPFAQFFMKFTAYGDLEYDLGPTPSGHLNLGVIEGGWIDGDRIKGRVLTGIDYGVKRPDDTHVPKIGLVCETDHGDRFLLRYEGIITPFSEVTKAQSGEPFNPAIVNWKVLMTFETSAPRIEWLNRTQAVARGAAVDGGIHYWAYELD
jgi:hypothetical protein